MGAVIILAMIASFANQGTEDVFDGDDTKAARRICPRQLWRVARRKLDMVEAAIRLEDLRVPPGNRLERLEEDREGQWGIRINDQYRVCFTWNDDRAEDVEITDYH
jgi:proteic killer suppression protein